MDKMFGVITSFALNFTILGLPATAALYVLGLIEFGIPEFLSVGVLVSIMHYLAFVSQSTIVVGAEEEEE